MNALTEHAEHELDHRSEQLRKRENHKAQKSSNFALTHQILVLDAYLEKRLDKRRYRTITRCFVAELLEVLGMLALGELGIYPAVDERAPGWSFIQPITTSHVSAHYFEKPGIGPHIRLDAYSCESIVWDRLIEVCHRHFCLKDWRATFIEREIDKEKHRTITQLAGIGTRITSNFALPQGGRERTEVAQ
ncbi:MAG: hypothetical protein AB8B57_16310 [Congregibacter sp.]